MLWLALDALPLLSEAELPPAVGLVLKLGSQLAAHRVTAVKMVRERVALSGALVSTSTMDALRLAVQQHKHIAAAMLADIEEEVKVYKAPTSSSSKCAPALPLPPPLRLAPPADRPPSTASRRGFVRGTLR